MLRSKCFLITVVMGAFLFSTNLSAQPVWLNHDRSNSLAIEILKPDFESGFGAFGFGLVDYDFLSSAMFLSGRFSMGDNLVFVGEFSFVYAKVNVINFNFSTGETFDGQSDSETTIGNPYLGVEFSKPNSTIFTELGLRLPITPDNKFVAGEFGVLSDFDRFEAFTPDILTLTIKINSRRKSASKVVTRLRGGPTLFLNTSGNGGDTEMFFDYSAQVGYEGEKVNILCGLTGRLLVSEDDLNFGQRTFHQITLAASLNSGQLQPGVLLRFPLDDDLQRIINYVFGLTLGIQLK